jgi:hypothetical protein
MATLAKTDNVPVIKTVPPLPQLSIEKNAGPQMDMIKAFLSKILASPNVMKDPSFFKDGVGSSTIGNLLQQTAAEIEKKKLDDKKVEEAVSAALRVETVSENNVLPSNFPFLADLQDSRGRQILCEEEQRQSEATALDSEDVTSSKIHQLTQGCQ